MLGLDIIVSSEVMNETTAVSSKLPNQSNGDQKDSKDPPTFNKSLDEFFKLRAKGSPGKMCLNMFDFFNISDYNLFKINEKKYPNMAEPNSSQIRDTSTPTQNKFQVHQSSSVSKKSIAQPLDDIIRTCFMDKTEVSGGIVNILKRFRKTLVIAKHKIPQTLLRVAISHDHKTKDEITENVIDSCLTEFEQVESDSERSTLASSFHIKEDNNELETLSRNFNVRPNATISRLHMNSSGNPKLSLEVEVYLGY